jgi:protease I
VRRIAILIEDGFEDSEFIYPYYRLIEAGIYVDIVGGNKAVYRGKHGTTAKATQTISGVESSGYDAVYIPGGHAPEKLQKRAEMVAFVRSMYTGDKIICAVCHGPILLASAGIAKGKKMTAYPAVKDELIDAGAHYAEKAVEQDGKIITARDPTALPEMMKLFLALLQK